MTPLPGRLLFIADLEAAGHRVIPLIHEALKGGCTWVLLRAIKTERKKFLATAIQTKKICDRFDAALSISRDAVIAREIGAAGLHLPSSTAKRPPLPPGMLLGQSCHNAAELRRAAALGVDYVFLSPVFPTASKPGHSPALGLHKFQALAGKTSLPVIALGGLQPQHAAPCLKAGAQALAIMGEITRSKNPRKKIGAFFEKLP